MTTTRPPLSERRAVLLALCAQVGISPDSAPAKLIRKATHAQLDHIETGVLNAVATLTRH